MPVPFFISLLVPGKRFNPAIVSTAGAQGIAQFMPETAADMGLENPFDPVQAIPASARLLRNLVAQFGNLGLAAAAYNAGPQRIQDWLAKLSGKAADKKTATKKPTEARSCRTRPRLRQDDHRPSGGNLEECFTAMPGQRLPRHAPCQEAAGLYAWSGARNDPAAAALAAHASRRSAVADREQRNEGRQRATGRASAHDRQAQA